MSKMWQARHYQRSSSFSMLGIRIAPTKKRWARLFTAFFPLPCQIWMMSGWYRIIRFRGVNMLTLRLPSEAETVPQQL